MGKYGTTALIATKLFQDGKVSSPNEAWELATAEIFPNSKSSQKKGCPKGAYLGLCEEGVIVGVPRGNYCRSQKNKGYALQAVSLLMQSPNRSPSEESLWRLVMEGVEKVSNHQMDVVLSLWHGGLIRGALPYQCTS